MMLKTGTVAQDSITKVEFDENSETLTEKIIVAKKRDFLDPEDAADDVQDSKLG